MSCSTAAPEPYGYAVPDDPEYSFELPSNAASDLVGLAAKGNIVIGDYTSYAASETDFAALVVPKLQPLSETNPQGKTHPYTVETTDVDLGYDSGDPALCGGFSPCFNGDYTVQDKDGLNPGLKADNTPRKFYESSLSDDDFRLLVDPNMMDADYAGRIDIDAVLFTNHALASLVHAPALVVNGAMVARDDAMQFNRNFAINHDIRLLDEENASLVVLPLDIGRPTLNDWRECQPAAGADTCE